MLKKIIKMNIIIIILLIASYITDSSYKEYVIDTKREEIIPINQEVIEEENNIIEEPKKEETNPPKEEKKPPKETSKPSTKPSTTPKDNNYTITKGGTYEVKGSYECIIIKTNEDIVLNINNLTLNCNDNYAIKGEYEKTLTINSSGTNNISAISYNGNIVFKGNGTINLKSKEDAIKSKKSIYVYNGTYNITTKDGYTSRFNKDKETLKGIKAKNTIVINDGVFNINTADDAVHSDETITINGGKLSIKSGDDAIHADNKVTINNGIITISNTFEGIESKEILIKKGDINISSADDSINATGDNKTGGRVTIDGGTIKLFSKNDCIDSNGSIIINNGNIYLDSYNPTGNTVIDHNDTFEFNGGLLIGVARSKGLEDNGEKTSRYPMLVIDTKPTNGNIKIDNINYSTKIDGYKRIIIASNTLLEKEYTLTLGDTAYSVNLHNGLNSYNYN